MMADDKKNGFQDKWLRVKSSKKLPVIAGVAFLVAITLVFFGIFFVADKDFSFGDRGKVVFTIDDNKYYEKDVESEAKYLIEVVGLNRDQAYTLVYKQHSLIAAGNKAGIQPNDDDIAYEKSNLLIKPIIDNEKYRSQDHDKWFDLAAKASAYNKYVGGESTPLQRGYSYVFYFGEHMQYGYGYTPEGFNDETLISVDRNYAKERADYYHSQLSDGKSTPEKVNEEIKNDPKLQHPALTTNPFGYNPETLWTQDVHYTDIIDYIESLESDGLSDVQVGKLPKGPEPRPEDLAEMYYYFVYMDELSQSKTVTREQFQTTLDGLVTTREGFTLTEIDDLSLMGEG